MKDEYERRKNGLLNDNAINSNNRKLFKKFFEFEEHKLKRKNSLPCLDNPSYKTLLWYCVNLRNANLFFQNKNWTQLTKSDIQKVYDNLEDGIIKNQKGTIHKSRKSFYNRIFKSKPFELAGKQKLAQEVIEFYATKNDEVRFIEYENFLKLVNVTIQPKQKFLLWLAFDIGENINALLNLQKKDFVRQINPETKEAEYIVNLPQDKIKRSRTSRSEITNFKETSEFADIILNSLKEDDKVFDFEYRQGLKFFNRAIKITGVICKPKGQKPSWKDLRSSMACYLLKEGWQRDEINARLGHKPSSAELDKYINYRAIDRHKPKQKLFNSNTAKMQNEIEELKNTLKLNTERSKRLNAAVDELKKVWQDIVNKIKGKTLVLDNKTIKIPNLKL